MNSRLAPRLVSLAAVAAALVVLSGCGGVDRRQDRRDDRQERREDRRDFSTLELRHVDGIGRNAADHAA